MKAYWFLGPSPYKTSRSTNAAIYANLTRAQVVADRALTHQECEKLIKRMKEAGLLETQHNSNDLFKWFVGEMKRHNLMKDEKPKDAPKKE
jgi:hypothetical protein